MESEKVSLFRNCYDRTPSEEISIKYFLTEFGSLKKSLVERVRECQDTDERRRMKLRLPVITPAGVFSERNKACLLSYSGYLCIDIDNLQGAIPETKDKLKNFPGLAYCGLSVSGDGLFMIVKISDPQEYEAHLESIFYDLDSLGIVPDKCCKDITRLRFVSYDDAPIMNFGVEPYSKKKINILCTSTPSSLAISESILDKVENCIRQIEESGVDITEGYRVWLSLAYAFANEFGETGRELFHRISRFYPTYDRREADRTFSACLKGRKITIATFFYYCKQFGIRYDY